MKMEKPSYVSAEIATCAACSLVGAVVTLVSFPCVPLYAGVAV